MNLSLKQFLQTGVLGQLHLGMPAQDVLSLLGPPDSGDVILQRQNNSYWTHGPLMISFGDHLNPPRGCTSIEWHPLPEASFPSTCTIEDWSITAEMTAPQVRAYLRDNGIKFHSRSSKGYFERKAAAGSIQMRLSTPRLLIREFQPEDWSRVFE